MQLLNRLRLRPFPNSPYLLPIYTIMPATNQMTEEKYLLFCKVIFLQLKVQLVLSKYVEHYPQVFSIFLQCMVVGHDVIKVHHHKYIQKLMENVIHQCTESGWDVGQAKGHDQEFECSISIYISHLFFIHFSNSNLAKPDLWSSFDKYCAPDNMSNKFAISGIG